MTDPIIDGQRLKCVGNVTEHTGATTTLVLCHPRTAEQVSEIDGPIFLEANIVDAKGINVGGCYLQIHNRPALPLGVKP